MCDSGGRCVVVRMAVVGRAALARLPGQARVVGLRWVREPGPGLARWGGASCLLYSAPLLEGRINHAPGGVGRREL